jgi:hypothetical protein
MPRPRRRLLTVVIAVAIAAATVVLGLLVGVAYARGRVLPAARAKLGRPVSAAHISVGLGRVVLRDVVVSGPADARDAPLCRAPRVAVRFALGPALLGRVRIQEVVVDQPRLTVRRWADGRDNVRDLVDRLRGKGGGGAGAGPGNRPRLLLHRGAVDAVDEVRGVAVHAGTLEVEVPPQGPATVRVADVRARHASGIELAAERLTATVPRGALGPRATPPTVEIVGGRFVPLASLALTGIHGTLAPAPTPGRIAVDLRGGYGGVPEELWTATGEVLATERRGTLDVTAARFTLDKLKPVLKETPVIDPEQTSIDASLKVQYAAGRLTFDGGLRVSGLALFHPRLGPQPVRNLDALGQVRGAFVPGERRLALDEAAITFRGVRLFASGEAVHIGRPTARYEAHVRVPPVPCAAALAALPEELTPALKGFRLRGTFKLDLRTKIDMADLDHTELEGDVGIRGCRVLEAPPQVTKLQTGFTHRVEVADRELSFWVGPENPDFVPFAEISPAIFAALTTTEDGSFFRHHGFIPSTFRAALVRNLKKGAFSLGGSTITMQMVKNTLLAREKTLARKLQELFLTWYVETLLDKERIMEIYLNVIEFGPFLYGIGPAARRYFGKPAAMLTPLEAAFFASILPNPKKRYVQYCKGALTPDWDRYVRRILAKMHSRGRITDEEYALYQNAELTFNRDEFPGERECYAQITAASAPTPRQAQASGDDDEPDMVGDDDDPNEQSRAHVPPRRRAHPGGARSAPPRPRSEGKGASPRRPRVDATGASPRRPRVDATGASPRRPRVDATGASPRPRPPRGTPPATP